LSELQRLQLEAIEKKTQQRETDLINSRNNKKNVIEEKKIPVNNKKVGDGYGESRVSHVLENLEFVFF
jgi:hypothetical protein